MYGGDISLDGFEIFKKEKKHPKKRIKVYWISYQTISVIDIETTGLYSEFDEIFRIKCSKIS